MERILSVELSKEHFEYPARYSPSRHHRGVFGIIGGEVTRVELLLMDRETAALLRARRLNLGERFHPRTDGTTLLTRRARDRRAGKLGARLRAAREGAAAGGAAGARGA